MLFEKEIKIDNAVYSLWCRDDFEIAFSREGGGTKKSGLLSFIDAFGWENHDFDVMNDCDNPFKTLRTIAQEFLTFIYKYNPPYVTFSAKELNRAVLYKRIALRYLKGSGYEYCKVSSDDTTFLFVRK